MREIVGLPRRRSPTHLRALSSSLASHRRGHLYTSRHIDPARWPATEPHGTRSTGASQRHRYRLNGLSQLLATNGQYKITIDSEGIADPAGIAGRDATTATWLRQPELPAGAVVQGKVFDDKNRNRTEDEGELPRVGWTVFLDLNGNNILDVYEPTHGHWQCGRVSIRQAPRWQVCRGIDRSITLSTNIPTATRSRHRDINAQRHDASRFLWQLEW